MKPSAPVRRVLRATLLGTLIGTGILPFLGSGAGASETSIVGLSIHGPEETLRDFCVREDGVLWLVLPNGARHELVTSTTDPAILNPGDGSFHPFDEATVRTALAELRAPVAPVSVEVFLLPYPRRAGLESAAGPGLILLSPGVRPLSSQHQHAEFVHELGHVIHHSRMPAGATEEWARYRELRGITDEAVYCATAAHANRPHEIFAEDFRALIGGPLANHSGTIENASLPAPATVRGLEDFMREIAGAPARAGSLPLACYPNPSREAVSFARAGGAAEPLDLYDLNGRRVATLAPVVGSGVVTWSWDGRGAAGSPVGAGVFFARPRAGGPALRLSRVR